MLEPFVLGDGQSLTRRRWVWRDGEERVGLGIAQRLGLPEIVGRLLAARGIGFDDAADFLEPTLRALLPDPSLLADMETAADRLAYAVRTRETVGVFGDYDVDGACSAALITIVLRALGCTVVTHVPNRITEGYGPNAAALHGLCTQGATLVVCVDCGTAAATELAAIAGRADAIVFDHHKSEGPPPPILATVNPNRLDDRSSLHNLCATAVAFLAAVALLRTLRRDGHFRNAAPPDLIALLDLVALATVCDVMPLTGLNRALVAQGLKILGRRQRPGIAALLDVALTKDHPTAFTCGFALGPRINAAGRISDAGLGLRLLLCDDPVEARALAAQLDVVNRDRQTVEAAMLDDAMQAAAAQCAAGHPVLVVSGSAWHQGVVGIVAGRIKQKFNRPALVGAIAEAHVKGSGRSVPGIDLGAAVIAARQAGILTSGGGHTMAAGFGLPESRLADFHAFLNDRLAAAADLPAAADLGIEGSISAAGATVELAQHVLKLAPFGAGNEEPTFVLPRVRVVKADRLGREGNTVRAYLEGEGGGRVKALLFRADDGPLPTALLSRSGLPLHVAGQLRAETWNETTTASFFVSDAACA